MIDRVTISQEAGSNVIKASCDRCGWTFESGGGNPEHSVLENVKRHLAQHRGEREESTRKAIRFDSTMTGYVARCSQCLWQLSVWPKTEENLRDLERSAIQHREQRHVAI